MSIKIRVNTADDMLRLVTRDESCAAVKDRLARRIETLQGRAVTASREGDWFECEMIDSAIAFLQDQLDK